MDSMLGIMQLIKNNYSSLTSAEKKICDYLTENYEKIPQLTAEAVAAGAGVAKSAVVRCSRSLGFKGFSELKARAAAECVKNEKLNYCPYISPEDGHRQILGKVFAATVKTLNDTAEKLGFYDDGVCGLAYKNKTFYCGSGNIPYRVFTDIAERAGVHIYYKNGIALCASTRFFMFATTHDENVEISMPFDCELCEKFSGRLYKTENKILRYNAKKGTAMLFEIKS